MILNYRSPFRLVAALWRAFIWLCYGRKVVAPRWVADNRELTCGECPHNENGQCNLCDGCFIAAKVLLSSEQCPDVEPRWKRLTLRANKPNPQSTT